jgi:hypothetical protein
MDDMNAVLLECARVRSECDRLREAGDALCARWRQLDAWHGYTDDELSRRVAHWWTVRGVSNTPVGQE